MSTGYWFADVDPEYQDQEYRWKPCLQLEGSICHSFEVWFATEDECRAYIAENIIGAALQDAVTETELSAGWDLAAALELDDPEPAP